MKHFEIFSLRDAFVGVHGAILELDNKLRSIVTDPGNVARSYWKH